jgi:DNA-binding beta-propeller fold protein YncE
MMNKITNFFFVAALGAFVFLAGAQITHADIAGEQLVDTIDPSPGLDAYGLQGLSLNHATHKLYVFGYPATSSRNAALKVIDTASNRVTAAIDLGRYAGRSNWFRPLGLEVDESAAPVGDKIYLIAASDVSLNACLRVIDGPSNTNLTGENTDLFLPVSVVDPANSTEAFTSLAVNSSNHKVYVAKHNGEIVVVDGPNRQILKVLSPNFGDLIVANPSANKIFVVNHNGGGVINSADDTFAPLLLNFTATAAVLDSAHSRIYFVGKALNNSNGIFAVDAATGELVGSKAGLAAPPLSVTVDPNQNTLYVGSASDLLAFNTADLSPKGSFAQPAAKLVCDSTASPGLFFLDDYKVSQQRNVLFELNQSTGVVVKLALGYLPFDLAVNNRTNRIYATDEQTNELLVIDGSNHAVVSRIPVIPPAPSDGNNGYAYLDRFQRHIAVSERLNRVYLPRTARNPSTQVVTAFIDVFDGGTNQFRSSIALDSAIFLADFALVDDTRRQLYIFAAGAGGPGFNSEMLLLVYDADAEALVKTISLGLQPGFGALGAAVNQVTGRVYIDFNQIVAIVDGNIRTKIASLDVGAPVGQIAINRKTNKAYVANTGYTPGNSPKPLNNVTVINGATDKVETTFSNTNQNGNDSVDGVAVDEVTNRVYVADGLFGAVTAFDANSNYQFLGQTLVGLSPTAIAVNNASRQIFVSHDLDGHISVLQDATPAPADIFGNISTRAHVGAGDDVLIGGFIIYGPPPGSKKLMIRAIGPSLTQAGVPGALPDTTLEVHDGNGGVITNDNWKINDVTHASQQAEIEATGIPPTSDLESALVMTLPVGQSVTAIVRGKDGAEGIGLVEVYDLDQTLPAKLVNISTRGHVGDGDDVMIAGVIVMGSKPVNVILHAIGPSLASSGVPNPLEDPVLELRDQYGVLIASNDDWQEHEAEVNATMLAPKDPRESAIVARLYPANYTAIARGKNGATGVALVDAYYLIVGQ